MKVPLCLLALLGNAMLKELPIFNPLKKASSYGKLV
jgi:hypothetical protein